MCGCHMEFLYFITILFLHLVHPLRVESTGCCVVNSVSSARSVTFTSPLQQAAFPTAMCVLSTLKRPLSVEASCHSQTAAILYCEWYRGCCHSLYISPCSLVLSACLPQVQGDDRQLLGYETRKEGNLPSTEEDIR